MLVRLSSLCPNAILQREYSLQVNWKCVISHRVGWGSSPLVQRRVLRPGTGGVNPLSPKSDKHLNSPYGITTISNIQVMKIKEMITNGKMC